MKVNERSREGAVVKVDVELEDSELQPHFENAYENARKSIKIDGFRKGKVPLDVVKKRFGEEIRVDAIDEIINEVYPEILKQAELKPITPGSMEDLKYEPGDKLQFVAVVEIMPEIEVNNWKGIKVAKEVVTVTDEDVDRHIEAMRRDNAIVSEKSGEDGVEKGNRATIDLQELDETNVVVIGRRSEDITFEVGNDTLGHDSDEQLIGMQTGDSRKIKTHRHVVDDKGRDSTQEIGWEVTLKKLERVELPELNDDFVAQVNPNLKTVAELRDDIRRQIENFANYRSQQRLTQRMIDRLVENHPFDLPPSLLAETLERMVQSRREESNNMIPEETLREQLSGLAERQLRWHFIKGELIEQLKLGATEEDVEKELKAHEERGTTDLKSLKLMFKSGERREQLEGEIVDGKLMKALISDARIDERRVNLNAVLD